MARNLKWALDPHPRFPQDIKPAPVVTKKKSSKKK